MKLSSIAFAVAAVGLSVSTGCGSSVSRHDVDALRSELGRLRERSASLEEKLAKLELEQRAKTEPREHSGESSAASEAAGAGAKTDASDKLDKLDASDKPELEVVKLAPKAAGDNADAADDGERIVLRSGAGGVVEERRGAAARDDAERDGSIERARELFKAKKFDKALAMLAALAVRAPEADRDGAGLLLRGDCYAAKGEQRRAIELYEEAATKFAKSARGAEALARIAKSYDKLNDKVNAEKARARLKAPS